MRESVEGDPGGEPRRRAAFRSPWWLLCKDGTCQTEILTIQRNGQETLPVFSHEEEAEMFVWFEELLEEGWRSRQSSPGALVSLLLGPCAAAESVALDPLPGMVADGTVGFANLNRKRFLRDLLEKWSIAASPRAGGGIRPAAPGRHHLVRSPTLFVAREASWMTGIRVSPWRPGI